MYIYIIQIHNKHTYAYKVYLRYTHVLVLAYHIPIDTYTHMYRAEVEKQTDRQMDGWMDGWMDRQIDQQID